MSSQTNESLVRRFFDEFCNGRKLDIAEAIFTPDYQYHDPQAPAPPGPQGMVEVVKVYQDGVEGHWQVEAMGPSGDDMFWARWTGSGKYTGAMPGVPVPPNGTPIRVDAISIFRIANGKIAEQWCVWDTLSFMQQIGAAPKP
jgi:predicted SnoaL-like aldol condensation-catalyzing enzyme